MPEIGDGIGGPKLRQALELAAAGVDLLDGLAEVLDGDLVAGQFLDLRLEVADLLLPQGTAGGPALVGHFHDIDRLVLGQELEHLLLAVAGGLADDEVG